MKRKHIYQGFFKKYHNVYLYITILVACGIVMGIVLSKYIDVNDIKSLSTYLTTINEGVDKYDYFVSQFFSGIIFILFVFFLGTSIIGIPILSFVVFTKGLQIGFSCALFVCSYQLKGVIGIFLTLLPQVCFDLLATFLISASALQLSMYIIYSTTNRERLDFKKLMNSILNDIVICFIIVLIGSYLKSTIVIEFIKFFNLM
ncbi:MAG: stage II sporulation protein M [Longicatena sp.]